MNIERIVMLLVFGWVGDGMGDLLPQKKYVDVALVASDPMSWPGGVQGGSAPPP